MLRETYNVKDVVTSASKKSAHCSQLHLLCGIPDEDFTKGTVGNTILELFCVGKLLIKTD